MPYTPIIATLGYVLSPDRQQVLLVHRNKRPDDLHYGKYNGLGGKVDADESVSECIRREVWEESGLTVSELVLRGTISWPGFGANGADWFGFIFRIDGFRGTPHLGNHEGALEWVALERISRLPMWESDSLFLPMVFDDSPAVFHGVMPYEGGRMVSWRYERL